MLRVALLLACAYAALSTDDVYEYGSRYVNNANLQSPTFPVQHKIWPPMPDTTYPPPIAKDFYKKYPYADSDDYYPNAKGSSSHSHHQHSHGQTGISHSHENPSYYPNDKNIIKTYDQNSGSENGVSSDGNLINLQSPPIPWCPPDYDEYLHDVEESIRRQRSHFTNDAIIDKDDKNFRYIILEHVVYNLAKEVAHNGWKNYNSSYLYMVKNFIDSGFEDPKQAVTVINCDWFDTVLQHTRRVKQLINQSAIQFVCKAQPSSCDAVIWTTIQLDKTPDVSESATALRIAAESAKTYLNNYASAFETISAQNVYRYLFLAENELRPLVASLATLHKYLKARGDVPCLL